MTGSVLKPIGDHLLKVATWNPLREAADQKFRYIDLSSVDNESKHIAAWQTVAGRDAPSRARQLVRAGDVLVSTVRPNLNGVARVPEELDSATASTGFCVLRADPRKLCPEYLFQWVKGREFIDTMVRQATGASYPAVSDRIIFASGIPLPPLPEQHRIAAMLDQADELRKRRRVALKLLSQLPQTVFVEMFGDPISNPKGWPRSRFESLAANQDGQRRPVKLSDRAEIKGIYPYYGASGIIDYVNDYLFDGPRLLIGEDGANLLARSSPIAFMASGRFWVNNHAHVLAENESADLRFLEYCILSIDLKAYVTGSAQPKLTQASLNSIEVYAPPISLQREFASRVNSIELLRDACRQHADKLDVLFASLQHRAFSGELTANAAELEMAS